jgi:SAM-dependent methyltransferase
LKTQLNTYPKVMAERADRDFFMWKLYPDLISNLLSERKVKTLCDLGSGTGSLLISFADEIDDGYGIDLSTEMTSIAHQKAEAYSHITFTEGDISNFTLPHQFSIIQCTDGVIPYLYDEDAVESFLKSVFQNLLSGGMAVLEFWTEAVNMKPSEYSDLYPERLSIYDEIQNEKFLVEHTKFLEGDDCRYRFYYRTRTIIILLCV